MPPFDREGALKKAEKALRMGRIGEAIEEYLRVVQAQPRDWNSANALGDLYVRAGQLDQGIAQYVKIADHLAAEGFFPKAAALYKKILKLKPHEEYALLRSGEIAARQGLLADAKQALQAVVELRRSRGDRKGAAEISIRIGTLDPDDLEARLGAARAAIDAGDQATAINEFREVGIKLDRLGRPTEALASFQQAFDLDPTDVAVRSRLLAGYLNARDFTRARAVARGAAELRQVAAGLEAAGAADAALDILADIARLEPDDFEARAHLAQAYAARGDLDKARSFLSARTAGSNPVLWLTLADIELRAGRLAEGRAAVVQALTLDPGQRAEAVAMACRVAESAPDAAYQCVDAVADAAVEARDYPAAAAALHEFVTRVRSHLVALMRLVEICVDGGLEATMYEAQAQLADAYLDVGRGLEARIISEDLVAREPWNRANIERFRRALEMLGEADPDAIIAERLSGESPFLATDKLDLNEGVMLDAAPSGAAEAEKPASFVRSGRKAADKPPARAVPATDAGEAPATAAPPVMAPPARSLDQVFRQFRDEADRESQEEAAGEQMQLALTYEEMGMIDDAVQALEAAALSPRRRFEAASRLGRLLLGRGEVLKAVEWFERAAEAPAPDVEAGRGLLYELADCLETVGEPARALAVFVELEADAGGYRDVAGRIERLSKVQAKG
ncbi:MAG: tetratricopeptide repeat protein [Acidobacteriota bacterium]